jgi:hypothetical protein
VQLSVLPLLSCAVCRDGHLSAEIGRVTVMFWQMAAERDGVQHGHCGGAGIGVAGSVRDGEGNVVAAEVAQLIECILAGHAVHDRVVIGAAAVDVKRGDAGGTGIASR